MTKGKKPGNTKLPSPYKLKSSVVGLWVDGHCGYLFVGYFSTAKKCIRAFNKKFLVLKTIDNWHKYNI